MSVINTNITSMIGQQNLRESQNNLQTSMERLSSGLRINSAKDDAAGQAISNRMTSQINGLAQAQRNANDGISIAQTAEGGLNQINDNLQRVRELTVQAQNGTNSASDIDSIQQEVNQRLEEIDRIARETDFNGTTVLDVDKETNIQIQVGADDGQTIDVTINDQGGWNLFDKTGSAGGDVNGEARDVRALGFDVRAGDAGTVTATVDASGSGSIQNADNVSFVSDNASGEMLIKNESLTTTTGLDLSDNSGVTGGDGTVEFIKSSENGQLFAYDNGGSGDLYLEITDDMVNADGTITADFSTATTYADAAAVGAAVTGITAAQLGTDTGSPLSTTGETAELASTDYYEVTNDMVAADGTISADLDDLQEVAAPAAETAQAGATYTATLNVKGDPLAQLDTALAAVDEQRSELGAIQNRFEDAISNLSTNETNLSAARSRIEDADYATEVADMTKNQILQQAGTSVLAQANQLPQSVLSLLG